MLLSDHTPSFVLTPSPLLTDHASSFVLTPPPLLSDHTPSLVLPPPPLLSHHTSSSLPLPLPFLSDHTSSLPLPLSVATLHSNPFAFTEDDYLALMAKESESLFQDEMYMKHLRKHANRIVLRVRQLHIIRWQILGDNLQGIRQGMAAK